MWICVHTWGAVSAPVHPIMGSVRLRSWSFEFFDTNLDKPQGFMQLALCTGYFDGLYRGVSVSVFGCSIRTSDIPDVYYCITHYVLLTFKHKAYCIETGQINHQDVKKCCGKHHIKRF